MARGHKPPRDKPQRGRQNACAIICLSPVATNFAQKPALRSFNVVERTIPLNRCHKKKCAPLCHRTFVAKTFLPSIMPLTLRVNIHIVSLILISIQRNMEPIFYRLEEMHKLLSRGDECFLEGSQ